jgi:hypothetical protein
LFLSDRGRIPSSPEKELRVTGHEGLFPLNGVDLMAFLFLRANKGEGMTDGKTEADWYNYNGFDNFSFSYGCCR